MTCSRTMTGISALSRWRRAVRQPRRARRRAGPGPRPPPGGSAGCSSPRCPPHRPRRRTRRSRKSCLTDAFDTKLIRLGDGRVGALGQTRDASGSNRPCLRVVDKAAQDWGETYPLPARTYRDFVYDGSGEALFYYQHLRHQPGPAGSPVLALGVVCCLYIVVRIGPVKRQNGRALGAHHVHGSVGQPLPLRQGPGLHGGPGGGLLGDRRAAGGPVALY